MESIYRQLQRKLNTIGVGLPESTEGYDLTYLKWLFTEEQAEFALKMERGHHTCEEIAESMGISVEEAREALTELGKVGLVYHFVDQDGILKYYLVSSYHGIFEWNLFRPDEAWIKPMVKHNIDGMSKVFINSETPMFRYIPSCPEKVENGCLDVDDKERMIRSKRRILRIPCFCRLASQGYAGKNVCRTDPDDYSVCIVFNDFADFFHGELGVGEEITADEALELVRKAEDKGYMHAVMNTTAEEGICNCCKCCCGILLGIRKFGTGKAGGALSNYAVQRDETKCVNCGACAKRCATRTLHFTDGKLVFNPANCIGCGLCLSVCKQGALKLFRKPDEQIHYPIAASYTYLNDRILKERQGTAMI